MKLTASDATPTIGDPFEISTTKESDNDIFNWSGPELSQMSSSNKISFLEAKFSNRGWYYCTKSNSQCNTIFRDSIYIDVKLSQEPVPCVLTDNFFKCNNLTADATLTSVTKGMDPTFNAMGVYGGDRFGFPGLRVLFNSYNGSGEPLDGVYMTNDRLTFDIFQPYNLVSISFNYNGSFFHCAPNQKLYVKHVNGKIQVAYCDMQFSNGTIFTISNAKMTEM